jgi:hypothetical protein
LYENENNHFTLNDFFSPENHVLYDVIEKKYGTAIQATDDKVIRCMRFACWTSKSTGTRLEHVILIAFPRQ